MDVERCKRCGTPIFWAKVPSGTDIPIDYRQVDDGEIVMQGNVAIFVPEVRRPDYKRNGARLWAPHTRWCKPPKDEQTTNVVRFSKQRRKKPRGRRIA